MSILIIVRHGQSVYNLQNRFTGNLDVDLTELGKEEARQTGVKLAKYTFDFAFTSKLKRAQKSLQIILQVIHQTKIPVEENAALNERMYGSLQGRNKAETIKKFGAKQVELWRRSYAVSPPNGESLAETYNRTIPYFKTAIAPRLKAGKTVLIVAHGNSLRALMMYLEKLNAEEIATITIPTAMPRKYVLDADLNVLEVNYL